MSFVIVGHSYLFLLLNLYLPKVRGTVRTSKILCSGRPYPMPNSSIPLSPSARLVTRQDPLPKALTSEKEKVMMDCETMQIN